MNLVTATLSGGFPANGAWRREVRLRELTGEEQTYLIEEAGKLPPARWTTETLRRCASRADNGEPLTGEQIRSLTVGDREALILQLRRLTSGDRMQCVLECPSPGCGAKLDVELRVSDLLVSPPAAQPETREVWMSGGGTHWCVRFRLPTGGDQEAVAELARENLDAAVDVLLGRLVHAAVCEDGSEQGPAPRTQALPELPEAVRQQLPQLMSELDPQAETNLHITCNACGGTFDVLFDAASYFFQELQAGLPPLFHEVHLLAYHYHWSLKDILGMSAGARGRFLQLLEDELSRGAN